MTSSNETEYSLAVETSGRVGSVGLACGDDLLEEVAFSTQHDHGVELLPTVDRLCRAHGVSPDHIRQVHVSGGPGSFTGLRIGITFAKAMAFAQGVRIVRVPTLDVIAQNALELPDPPPRLAVVLDAKRRNIFSAAYRLDGGVYVATDEPNEREPAGYLGSLGEVAVLGEGIAYHAEAIAKVASATVLPDELNRARAAVVHRLGMRMAREGRFTAARELIPIYVRRPEAEEKWDERHGNAGS